MRLWLELGFETFAALSEQASSHQFEAARDEAAEDVRDVQLARGGDGEAFARLVRRHQQEIGHRLCRFTRDPLVLEELVQETFVQAYVSLHTYRSESPLIHWLHRIAVRVGYRSWKVRRLRPTHVAIEGHEPIAPLAKERGEGEVDRVMAMLGPRDRLVLTLLYLESRSERETAALTGWSQTMVKVQAYRARARLRKLMLQERDGDES